MNINFQVSIKNKKAVLIFFYVWVQGAFLCLILFGSIAVPHYAYSNELLRLNDTSAREQKRIFHHRRLKLSSSQFKQEILYTAQNEPVEYSVRRSVLEEMYHKSKRILRQLPITDLMQRVSWKHLKYLVKKTGKENKEPKYLVQLTLDWIDFTQHHSDQFIKLYELKYRKQKLPKADQLSFIRFDSVLLTPGMNSMLNHCKTSFGKQVSGWEISVVYGHHSPAYQTFLLGKLELPLRDSFHKIAPPGYSRHHLMIPDFTINMSLKNRSVSINKPWNRLIKICRPFGFTQSYPGRAGLEGEFKFPGIKILYGKILSHKLIKPRFAKGFLFAMEKAGFYPSPEALQILLALGAQESSLQWNPVLNKKKKRYLKSRFFKILSNIENSFSGVVTDLIISEQNEIRKRELIQSFKEITNPKNIKIKEYDFYLWTRQALSLLEGLLDDHENMTEFGQWLFELKNIVNQVIYEPQTFGLWQINVNYLKERIEAYPKLHRRFPALYEKKKGEWQVNRESLVDALCGVKASKISRRKTLELIIHTYLAPRYKNHFLGEKNDLLFFIAENMVGEMSTFKAAVQSELNRKMGSGLVIDGDLAFYFPYSTQINWERQSNSQKILTRFINANSTHFQQSVNSENLVKTLCTAQTWSVLRQSELYRLIMGKKRGLRVFPRINTSLYKQSPFQYAKIVKRKAKIFR